MIDISSVFLAIKSQFIIIYTWMSTHGVSVAGWDITWFELFTGSVVVAAILSALIPWYDDEEYDE